MTPALKTPPSRALYTPPEGYQDFPFTWAFDGSALTDGTNALNQFVYIQGGWGDFIMRRCVGLASVVNPVGGSFQLRDAQKRPLSSDPVLIGSINDDLAFPNELLYPETSVIGFDLYDVLRDPPPVFQGTPVLIDPTGFSTGSKLSGGVPDSSAIGGQMGVKPWVFRYGTGMTYFMVLATPTAPFTVTVWKTTNGGSSWTQMDAAHQPNSGGSGLSVNCYYPGGSTVYMVYVPADVAADDIAVNSFNFSTGLWGGESPILAADGALAGFSPGLGGGLHITRLSNGNIYVFWIGNTTNGATHGPLWYCLFSGGVWGTITLLTGTNVIHQFDTPLTVITDSSDITHILYEHDDTTVPSSVLNYIQLSAAGIPSAAVTVLSAGALGGGTVVTGSPVINGTDLWVPIFYGTSGASNQIHMLHGAGLPAPSWTVETPDPGHTTCPGAAVLQGPPAALYDTGATLWVFWVVTNQAGDTGPQQIWASSRVGGVWTTPTLYYDYALNPPGSVPFGSGIHSYIQRISVTAGSFLIHAMMPLSLAVTAAGFALAAAGPKILQTQIAFQGVRRLPRLGNAQDDSCDYDERTFTYPLTATLATAGPATAPVVVQQNINDYDFDLYNVILTYQAGSALPRVVCSVLLFDYARNQISNIPLLDVYLNGAPGSPYQNGAIVPPLRYRQNTQIQLYLYSLTSIAPVTVTVHLVGRQRLPKLKAA